MDAKRKPPFPYDPVVEAYKKDVDRTLIRENLKLTVTQRSSVMELQRFAEEIRRAGVSRPRRTFVALLLSFSEGGVKFSLWVALRPAPRESISEALPYLRGTPAGLPLVWMIGPSRRALTSPYPPRSESFMFWEKSTGEEATANFSRTRSYCYRLGCPAAV